MISVRTVEQYTGCDVLHPPSTDWTTNSGFSSICSQLAPYQESPKQGAPVSSLPSRYPLLHSSRLHIAHGASMPCLGKLRMGGPLLSITPAATAQVSIASCLNHDALLSSLVSLHPLLVPFKFIFWPAARVSLSNQLKSHTVGI